MGPLGFRAGETSDQGSSTAAQARVGSLELVCVCVCVCVFLVLLFIYLFI